MCPEIYIFMRNIRRVTSRFYQLILGSKEAKNRPRYNTMCPILDPASRREAFARNVISRMGTTSLLAPLMTFIILLKLLKLCIFIHPTPFTHPQPIIAVHLAVPCPGRHLQPYYWYILSWHVQFTTVSAILSFHVVLKLNPSYIVCRNL